MSATAPRMSCCSARLSRLQKHRSNVKHNQNCASGGHSVSWIVAGVASSPIARLLSAALLVGNAASQSPSADACPGDELTSSRAETNLCLESSRASSWESTKRPTPPAAGGMPQAAAGCTGESCTWWPLGDPHPDVFNSESSDGIVAPGFEVSWDGSGWRGMEGWVFDQRVYTQYTLLATWEMEDAPDNRPSGDFTGDTRFSKPVHGANCPWVLIGSWAAGCEVGALMSDTLNDGRAHSCTGSRCANLAFGASKNAYCDHDQGPGCVARESVSQTITIPWNAKELKFKHRRGNAGGTASYGGWARLVINRPGVQAAVPPECQVCPWISGELSEGPCDSTRCDDLCSCCTVPPASRSAYCHSQVECPEDWAAFICPDWTYTPPVCSDSTCPRTSTGSDVLWEVRCLAVDGARGPDGQCQPTCEDPDTGQLGPCPYVEETIDITPYVYDIDAATRGTLDTLGTCETTVVAACADAAADESTCTSAGSCTFTPGSDSAAATCTTTIVPECASANADAATCADVGACTYTSAPVDDGYQSRRQKLFEHGQALWAISFQAHTIDMWAVYVDELSMTFFRPGCTDSSACNYDSLAEIDDGTCVAKKRGCTNPTSANYDPDANTDPGDMCIAFAAGQAPTLKDIQLGSTKDSPTLTIPVETYDYTDADGIVHAISLGGLEHSVKYPYWSHQIQVSPGWEGPSGEGGSPVGFKVSSGLAEDFTLLVYEQFGPKEPRGGLLHTARQYQSGIASDWRVKCEDAEAGECASNMCQYNGLVRTYLAPDQVYTLVVIPSDAGNYQADATGQAVLSEGQGKFDLDVFADLGAIKEISPVCGNGVVEGTQEQCDPKSGAELEWCTPPPCSGTATDMSTYNTGPSEFHWYTPAYHCVAAYESAIRAGSSGVRGDCPAGCDWSGHGGCQGILASVFFEEESVRLSEGDKVRVKIKRRRSPNWLPHTDSRVRVKVYTADGEGPNAAHADGKDGADDYDEIKAEFLDFEACTDGESLSCTEQFLEIETFSDNIFEYPTEHFYVLLDVDCDRDNGCSHTAKLEYPTQLRVEIVNDPWAPSEFIVATIGILCVVMFGITAWLTSWIYNAHSKRFHKLQRESADSFKGDAMYGDISPTTSSGASPSFRSNRSPSYRSNSIAPAPSSFHQRRTSVLADDGQNGSRRASVAPGQHGTRRASVLSGQNGTRRASVAPGAERRSSIAPGTGGVGRKQRAPSVSGSAGGRNGLDGMDEGALAALHESVEGMGKRRTQSDASRRKGSVSMGGGGQGAGLGLANRVKGGDGGTSSGRRRRGSVREIEPEDDLPSVTTKASSSGRRRRGSVKEISLEPAKKEITLGRSDSKPKASHSSGRRRRGSVKEVSIPDGPAVSATATSQQTSSSSGRRRRGSVKEIDPEDARAPVPASQSSGRRRRGSVKEIEPDDAKARVSASQSSGRRRRGSVKEIEPADAISHSSKTSSSSTRRRRGSVNDVIPVSGSPKATDLTSASVTTSRRRRTSVTGVGGAGNVSNQSETKGVGRRASVAAGGSRRASVKPGALDEMDGYPPGVVSKLSGLDSGGSSFGKSRRQPVGDTSPANGRSGRDGKSPKGTARARSGGGSGSDGTASPNVVRATEKKESSRPKRGGGGGGYTNAAMFHAMQAALAQSEYVLDENKGLVGKLKLTGTALLGGLCTATTTIVFLNLTSSELDSCEAVTDGQCVAHMVGNGHCDWECNIDECMYDGDDCEFYTDACRFAWYHDQAQGGVDPPDLCGSYDNNAFISPAGLGDKPIENNVVMGCFSLEQVDAPLGPDNPPTLMSRRLKDGKCDPACNFAACGLDGGDCEEAQLKASPQCSEGCYSHMMGDRRCDPECNTPSCFFDLRDCTDSYNEWQADTVNQAQQEPPDGLPEALICDRETSDPTQMQCGLMNNVDVLNAIYSLNFDDQNELKGESENDEVDPARSEQDFVEECDEDEPKHLYDKCTEDKTESYNTYTSEVADTWDRAAFQCPTMAQAILKLHRETQINNLVATLTHTRTCQERCDTPSCGHDAGACFDDNWCAPGCSPDKLLNLVCDQECFSAACGWDAPACNGCDAFVDPQAGLYKDAISSLAEAKQSSAGMNTLVLATFVLSVVILVLRVRSTIIIALDGFFEPMGQSMSRICNKEELAAFDPRSVSKSRLDRYTAPLWPIAYAGPLLVEPKADWMEDEDEYNEDSGRYGLKYHSSAVEYSSEDSEPMRLELHQAQTAALASTLGLMFVISSPVMSLVARAEPKLAGATQLTKLSIGNIFDPESACKYPLGMYELLSSNLRLLWAEDDDGFSTDGKPQCGPASLAVHAFLLADVLAMACFLLLLRSRYQDLRRLRSAHPRLSDYCVHVSGLGRGTKLASDIIRMTKQLKWLNEKDHADDVTVLPIWQDDLHWAWASLQKANLDAVGNGESHRGDELKNLVHKLEGSRTNVAYPRPFSGHVICIFHKQYMARAMLHTYKMPIFKTVLKLLLPGEDLGGDETDAGEKKTSKVKVAVERGGDPDDIDWLSFRSGGSASFADMWRGRVVRIGALLSLVSVLMLSLAIIFNMKQADPEKLKEAMAITDAKQKATATLQALAVPPFSGSLLIILLTELGAWIVSFTATRAAPYRAHTYSAQRKYVIMVSSFAQVCTLILFPYMLLGDPFSWHSAGTVSATSAFGKCKPVVEKAVNQELPGAEFIPGGFAEMVLWLQVLNATLPHLLGLMNFSRWPQMILEALGKAHGTAHGWEFDFSLATSQTYTVRTVALALSFSVVQPAGLALAAIGLLIGYSVDRLRAGQCTAASSRSMRRGAGVGDVYDQQVVLTLVQSTVAVHALLLFCWIDSVRLVENPFIVNDFSASPIFLYPILELLAVLISLGPKAQGTVCWFVGAYFLVTVSYTLLPIAGRETENLFGIGEQPGGPNIVVLLTIILSGAIITPFARPMSWFLGPLDPIEVLTKGKRESDEEAYYTASEMPFKPKSIIDDQIAVDVASIRGLL